MHMVSSDKEDKDPYLDKEPEHLSAHSDSMMKDPLLRQLRTS